jgi:hypothetical protein
MQDVIIESSNQSSSLAANVRKVTIKKSRGIFSYMFDWLIKGLWPILTNGMANGKLSTVFKSPEMF